MVEALREEPARRRIWLCADDYGIAPGVSAAIRDLALGQRLNATSAMIVAPSMTRAEASSLNIINAVGSRIAIGLHVTLTAPLRPLVAGFAPLREGAFLPLPAMMKAAFLRKLDPAALAREIEAQFDAFTATFGRLPAFADGHQHVHLLPQVRDAFLDVVKRKAPQAWVRQCGLRRQSLSDPKGLLLTWLSGGLRARAERLGIATNPAFAGTYTFRDDADFASLFPDFLEGLPDGSVVMCHPGKVDAELERLDPLTRLREKEHAYLAGPNFPKMLEAQGVTLA
jgi:predicted glycoside hydrolase/deacetylase ChbG (UPF0249 family)